ncbi:MAG TPA: hypothetical protein VFK69_00890 [Candidatus Eisenbacteria bacterium]|nr:hypothetical protein [Candidatus Eisenbacteria bacterium]
MGSARIRIGAWFAPCLVACALAAHAAAPPAPPSSLDDSDSCEAVVPLTSTASAPVSAGHDAFTCDQQDPFWTAVGVRAPDDMDVDLFLDPTGGPAPACFGGLRASSAGPGRVDVVVGDFNFDPYDTMYVHVRADSAGTPDGRIEWDSGRDPITAGDPPVARTTDSTDVLECWDLYMEQDYQYTLHLDHSGPADVHLLLFANPADSLYWAGRASAALELTGGSATFVASRPGWYGLVAVNDNGAAGSYDLSVHEDGLVVGVPRARPAPFGIAVTPNPLHGAGRIRLTLPRAGRVQVELYDVAARRVRASQERWLEAGSHEWQVDAPEADLPGVLAPGVYLVAVKLDGLLAGSRRIVVR